MNRIKRIMSLCVCTVCLAATAKVATVLEKETGMPVEGATAFGRSGRIVGQTDAAGRIQAPDAEFPLTIRCMGYRAGIADGTDTLRLEERDYALDTVTVSPGSRPVTRIVGFAREYATGATTTDTVTQLSEFMAELYLAPDKTKGYKKEDSRLRIRNRRALVRTVRADGTDSIYAGTTDISLLQHIFFIPAEMELTDLMKRGAPTGQIPGKYAPRTILRTDGRRLRALINPLSDFKEQKMSPWIFKLLGLSMDMTRFDIRYDYRQHADTSAYLPAELLESAVDARIVGSGRWIKKAFGTKEPVTMDMYMEFYPLDVTHLSIDEYKELRSDKDPLPWATTPSIPPLPAPYDSITHRLTTQQNQ